MTDFTNFYQKYQPIIDHYLEQHLSSEIEDKKFSQIMAYSVMAGGKRLRPLLFLATLIHDDLPAMDNDDYRRGMLTSHKKWGEAEAILAGDALLPMGLEWIASAENAEMVAVMANAIGPNGMAGGQYLDIDSTNNDAVKEDNNFINRMEWLKTGCLIKASVEIATIYAKADDLSRKKLVDFSANFGRAYQIYDDLVDVVQTSQEAGKATHKDEEEGKNNTLTLLGIDESRKELQELILAAKNNLTDLNSEVLLGFLNLYKKVL